MYSKTIQKLIEHFSKFPTVGRRTAERFVFHLMRASKPEVKELINSIAEVKNKVKICPSCFKSFEGEQELCSICSDARRDKKVICIVEKEVDLESIEKTRKFKGTYLILGGTFLSVEKEGNKKTIEQRIKKLIERIKKQSKLKEVVLAINQTPAGNNTCLWIQRKLKPLNIKTTHLGCGLPVGGELEYADGETISSAFESRK
jgi:recombination protein RecR